MDSGEYDRAEFRPVLPCKSQVKHRRARLPPPAPVLAHIFEVFFRPAVPGTILYSSLAEAAWQTTLGIAGAVRARQRPGPCCRRPRRARGRAKARVRHSFTEHATVLLLCSRLSECVSCRLLFWRSADSESLHHSPPDCCTPADHPRPKGAKARAKAKARAERAKRRPNAR